MTTGMVEHQVMWRAVKRGAFVFVFLLAGHGFLTVRSGIVLSSDSQSYSRWADQLIELRFDYGEHLHPDRFLFFRLFRVGFVTLVALLKLTFGFHWAVALVVLNHLAMALTGTLLVQTVIATTRRMWPGWVALGFFTGSYDLASWNRYALSDSTFVLLVFVPFVLLLKPLVDPEARTARLAPALLLLLFVALLYRGTAIALLIPAAAGVLLWRARSARAALLVTAAVLLLLAAAVFVAAWIGEERERWPFPFFRREIGGLIDQAAKGEVVQHRPETYHRPPVNYGDYLMLFGDRFVRFFQVTADGFSRMHNAYQVAYFIPLYLGACLALLPLPRRRGLEPATAATLLAFLTVMSFAAFHAVTILDFDWRYRLPVIPVLIFLSALGFFRAFTRFAPAREVRAP